MTDTREKHNWLMLVLGFAATTITEDSSDFSDDETCRWICTRCGACEEGEDISTFKPGPCVRVR